MPKDSQLQQQAQLVHAIQDRADVGIIKKLIAEGANANDAEVMQIIEELYGRASEAWLGSITALPEFVEAKLLRDAADQAAFDLIDSIETNDVDGVSAALDDMLAAGDDANMDMGEGSMLALAITHRCKIEIMELLLNKGGADVKDFSRDAIDELKEVVPSTWKTNVQRLFGIRSTG